MGSCLCPQCGVEDPHDVHAVRYLHESPHLWAEVEHICSVTEDLMPFSFDDLNLIEEVPLKESDPIPVPLPCRDKEGVVTDC
jgi:hypothetical protein